MNKVPAFLLLSLVANAALAMLVYTKRAPGPVAPAPGNPGAVAAARPDPTRGDPAAARIPAGPAPDPAEAAYVTRLRTAGMPAELIHALVYNRVHARYRDRMRALLPKDAHAYWRTWNTAGRQAASPEIRAQLRALNQEMSAEVRALLGDGPDAMSPYERRLHDQLAGSIPNEKLSQIEAIRKDYDELTARVREQSRGLVLRADREQLRLLERERRADLAAVLTPEELFEYDLRASPTANSVRNRLNFFEPTEAEFRALTRLQLEFDGQYGVTNLSGPEQDRRRAAESDLTAKIQAALTPTRFNDYLVAVDGMFSQARHFVATHNLAPDIAKEIVALKQSAWKQADELNRDGITPEQRAAGLQSLHQEVEARLSDRLGAEAFANYKRSGASWMNRLRAMPPRP
ncbi:MAG TPA: hypothetical protein VHN79_05560 [Lacunisphaera sp.]|nr:hypothetical protein [Lacunisphaera sp.]